MKFFYLVLSVFIFAGFILADDGAIFPQEFDAKKTVKINTVSGDCILQQGNPGRIVVDCDFSVQPENAFTPEIREKGNSLRIKERWHGSSSGKVVWTITVPPETEIEFSTASGELSIAELKSDVKASTASGDIIIEDCSGEFDLNTASGEIQIEGSKGEFELSTASGDIDVEKTQGVFELSCASGDIEAANILIEEESSFSTASGDVEVLLTKSSEYNLELSAASGDVVLDYKDNPIKGTFEFIAKKRSGRIVSPVDFDNEEEFDRGNDVYMKKSFTKGNGSPKILLETASGRAELKWE
jgi:hypothetical protein